MRWLLTPTEVQDPTNIERHDNVLHTPTCGSTPVIFHANLTRRENFFLQFLVIGYWPTAPQDEIFHGGNSWTLSDKYSKLPSLGGLVSSLQEQNNLTIPQMYQSVQTTSRAQVPWQKLEQIVQLIHQSSLPSDLVSCVGACSNNPVLTCGQGRYWNACLVLTQQAVSQGQKLKTWVYHDAADQGDCRAVRTSFHYCHSSPWVCSGHNLKRAGLLRSNVCEGFCIFAGEYSFCAGDFKRMWAAHSQV